MTIKVLVIDDSTLIRVLLTEIINSAPDLEVVGSAPDPLKARDMIKALNPDVLTLDVEMPKMDGLDFLQRLMRLRPMPVVMISSHTESGSDTALRALELGAIDFVPKPRVDASQNFKGYTEEICDKIRAAYEAQVRPAAGACAGRAAIAEPPHVANLRASTDKLVLIGASTGGTEAIKVVLTAMPEDSPGILMVQHMLEMFTGSFARRLDGLCRIRVKEAEDGERVAPGHAYLAPGHSHLAVRSSGGTYFCELSRAEPVNRHRPSVDVLFETAAQVVRHNAVAALLTGMGKDGALGMLALRRAGAYTIAQDQASCVVYGMPREAAAIGAASEVAGLHDIAGRIVAQLRGERRTASV